MDAVAFDGHQAGARIGRRDLHGDFVAGRVLGAVQLQIEFGVAFQVASQIALASHGERHAAQHRAIGICQLQREASRHGGGQDVFGTLRRQRERRPGALGFLQHGLVGVGAVVLLHQCRNVAAFQQHRLQAVEGCGRRVRGQRLEAHRAHAVLGDELQLAVGLVPHQRAGWRKQRAGNGFHPLSAIRLEPFDGQPQLVDAVVVAAEIEGQTGDALGVGDGFVELLGDAARLDVRVAVRVGEDEARVGGKARRGRHQFDAAAHAPMARRRAEQVLQHHLGDVLAGGHPAMLGAVFDLGANA